MIGNNLALTLNTHVLVPTNCLTKSDQHQIVNLISLSEGYLYHDVLNVLTTVSNWAHICAVSKDSSVTLAK